MRSVASHSQSPGGDADGTGRDRTRRDGPRRGKRQGEEGWEGLEGKVTRGRGGAGRVPGQTSRRAERRARTQTSWPTEGTAAMQLVGLSPLNLCSPPPSLPPPSRPPTTTPSTTDTATTTPRSPITATTTISIHIFPLPPTSYKFPLNNIAGLDIYQY